MRLLLATSSIALLALGACNKRAEAALAAFPTLDAHGRYAGVGVYSPGEGWTRIAAAGAARNAAATVHDDEAVIVVVDSVTGETRACGDLSGYCIAMNAWARPLPPEQGAPVDLTPRKVEGVDAPAEEASATPPR